MKKRPTMVSVSLRGLEHRRAMRDKIAEVADGGLERLVKAFPGVHPIALLRGARRKARMALGLE